MPGHSRPKRLPITPDILRMLHSVWSQEPRTTDKIMLWAACCLGFFGFLRAGEFTHPASQPEGGLEASDIATNSRTDPQTLIVHLRHSKTDPFSAGVRLVIGRTGDILCPVTAVLCYLARRPPGPGPLFLFADGTPLSRALLVHHVHEALGQAGYVTTGFSGHSFRIGAATTAARAGLSDSLIQTLGRWKSSAFLTYIRTPVDELKAVAARLASQ